MREAAETPDDVEMGHRIAVGVEGLRKPLEWPGEVAGALLVFQGFAVLEGQVSEQALHGKIAFVVALRHGVPCRAKSQGIRREGARRAAEHVARELVEQNDERQAGLRLGLPAGERSGAAQLVRDRARIKELWNPFYTAWFPEGIDDPDVALLRVEVDSAEYWEGRSSTVAHIIGLAKVALTGKPANVGENEAIKLK